MGLNIAYRKDHLIKNLYQNKVRERKILGFPQENSPVKAYSNVFYWSHVVSDFGAVIPEKPMIGFEVLNYVLTGAYESINREGDQWHVLYEGDMEIISAGKGIRVTEKFYPNTEVLQIWLDPNFSQSKKTPASLHQYSASSFPVKSDDGIQSSILKGKDAPIELFAKDINIHLSTYQAGNHTISVPENTVLSVYILDGYLDIEGKSLSKNDFFTVDEQHQALINTLSDCKLFILSSPLVPEYERYAEMKM